MATTSWKMKSDNSRNSTEGAFYTTEELRTALQLATSIVKTVSAKVGDDDIADQQVRDTMRGMEFLAKYRLSSDTSSPPKVRLPKVKTALPASVDARVSAPVPSSNGTTANSK